MCWSTSERGDFFAKRRRQRIMEGIRSQKHIKGASDSPTCVVYALRKRAESEHPQEKNGT